MPRQLLLRCVALAGVVLCAAHTRAQSPPQPDFVTWADACVAAWGPTAAERRFDEIGWSTEIRAALALAKEHQRPVFLFTHDGRMAVGRQ
jgi:hypothetical protein